MFVHTVIHTTMATGAIRGNFRFSIGNFGTKRTTEDRATNTAFHGLSTILSKPHLTKQN